MVLATKLEALPLLDVEGAMARVPPEARARAAWSRGALEAALRRLREEPLTDALVDEVTASARRPLHDLTRSLWPTVGIGRAEAQAAFMADLRREQDRLERQLADPEARDTLEWVLGYLGSLAELTFATVAARDAEPALTEAGEDGADAIPTAWLRAQAALMAAVEHAKTNGSPERTADLIDVAFLATSELARDLRNAGVWVAPFPRETTDERRARALAAADTLRDQLSSEDWSALDGARLAVLR